MFLVTPLTIQNCFRKAKFVFDDVEEEDVNFEDEEDEEIEDEEVCRFVTFDDNLRTGDDLTDAEICENIMAIEDESEAEDEDAAGASFATKMKWAEGIEAMHKFRRFLEENYEDFDRMPLAQMEEIIEQETSKMRKQASILDYFPIVECV